MDFGLSEEQRLLQDTLRNFAGQECPLPRLRELFEAGQGHDPELWKGLVEIGVGGLALPEAHGGSGLEVLDLALVAEVLGEAALPVPFLGHALAGLAIAWGGSEAQQAEWLPKLATGDVTATVALLEGSSAWQPEEWALAPGASLRGEKRYVPDAARADLLVVGTQGGGFALVETGDPGVSWTAEEGLDRTRGIAHLHLDGAKAEALPGAGAAARVRDAALAILAADAFGAAWRLLRMTIEYAGTREQFGTPLAQFQGVKHQIANAATSLEPARGLWWYAAHAVDQLPDRAPHASAHAKAHLTDRAIGAARDAVELHGGIGYTWESDVQIWFKRVLFDRTFLGGPEVHRERAAQISGW
ncbi:MAG: acyl-CoA dehydrogenase family protein [Myxococcota bacterium]